MLYKWISYLALFMISFMVSGYSYDYTKEYTPRAFEKLYVTPRDILCTHEGTFYNSPTGETIKVASISRDADGPYIILITRQCPVCGRLHSNGEPVNEEYDCPLWDKQREIPIYRPNIR